MTTTPLIPWDGFDFDRPSRVADAVRHIGEIVGDREPHAWPDIVASVAVAHDLLPKTVANLLYGMVARGDLIRGGQYNHRSHRDHRTVRLHPRLSA